VLSDAAEVDNSFTASLDPTVETLTRLESSYTQDLGTQRLRVGDAVSTSATWSNPVRYGGMQFGTQSSGRGDVIASNELATAGVAVLPTVADALFMAMGDPGSSLTSRKLAVDRSWRGDGGVMGLVARDAFGRSTTVDAPMIAATQLADPGCGDFSVGVGKVRRDYAITSNDYGPTFANTTVKCGIPLGFTIEGHGEYLADDVTAFGLAVARPLGPIGTASVAVAQSHSLAGSGQAGSGWLTRVGFDHDNSVLSLRWKSRYQTREYREVGAVIVLDPLARRDLASIGVNTAPGSQLSLAYATQTTWSREKMNLIALTQSMMLGRGALSMSAGHSLTDSVGSTVFISYRRSLGTLRVKAAAIQEFDIDALTAPLLRGVE
jgi:outer membrane usher protein